MKSLVLVLSLFTFPYANAASFLDGMTFQKGTLFEEEDACPAGECTTILADSELKNPRIHVVGSVVKIVLDVENYSCRYPEQCAMKNANTLTIAFDQSAIDGTTSPVTAKGYLTAFDNNLTAIAGDYPVSCYIAGYDKNYYSPVKNFANGAMISCSVYTTPNQTLYGVLYFSK